MVDPKKDISILLREPRFSLDRDLPTLSCNKIGKLVPISLLLSTNVKLNNNRKVFFDIYNIYFVKRGGLIS